MIANIIYILLCAIYGVVSVKANIKINDWKYWIILGCIVGAFLCGTYA